jgi:hypothetical protein
VKEEKGGKKTEEQRAARLPTALGPDRLVFYDENEGGREGGREGRVVCLSSIVFCMCLRKTESEEDGSKGEDEDEDEDDDERERTQ